MWCNNCQNNVPMVVSDSDQGPICARCNQTIERTERDELEPPAAEWELSDIRDDIRSIECIVGSLQQPSPPPSGATQQGEVTNSKRSLQNIPLVKPSLFGSALLLAGLLALSFGAALVIWSFVNENARLWAIGLPVVLAGQSALLVGLWIQCDRAWQAYRGLHGSVIDNQRRVSELHDTSHQLAIAQAGSASSFYHHFAHQASPHLFLAQHNGQLDHLSERDRRGTHISNK